MKLEGLDVMRAIRHEESHKEVGREILDAISTNDEDYWWPDAATPEDIAALFPDLAPREDEPK